MIKINLLEVETKERRPKAVAAGVGGRPGAAPVPVFLIGAVLVGAALAGIIIWYVTLSSQVSALQKDVADKEQKKKELEPYIKRVDELEARRNELTKKNRAIEELRSQRTIPVHILDEVSRALPEYLWLNSMSLKGGQLNIEGETLQEQAIPTFMKNLDASEFIGSTSMIETRQKQATGNKPTTTTFKITSTITNPFKPKDEPAADQKTTTSTKTRKS